MALETGCLQSRCPQGHTASGTCRAPCPACPSFWDFLLSLEPFGLLLYGSSLCHCVHTVVTSVSVSSHVHLLVRTPATLDRGSTSLWHDLSLITSATPLLPRKLQFEKAGRPSFSMSSFGGHNSTPYQTSLLCRNESQLSLSTLSLSHV